MQFGVTTKKLYKHEHAKRYFLVKCTAHDYDPVGLTFGLCLPEQNATSNKILGAQLIPHTHTSENVLLNINTFFFSFEHNFFFVVGLGKEIKNKIKKT